MSKSLVTLLIYYVVLVVLGLLSLFSQGISWIQLLGIGVAVYFVVCISLQMPYLWILGLMDTFANMILGWQLNRVQPSVRLPPLLITMTSYLSLAMAVILLFLWTSSRKQFTAKVRFQYRVFSIVFGSVIILSSAALNIQLAAQRKPNNHMIPRCEAAQLHSRIEVHLADYNQNSPWKKVDGISIDAQPVLGKTDIVSVALIENGIGAPTTILELSESGSQKLSQSTASNIGKFLAILVDGQIINTPLISGPTLAREIPIDGEIRKFSDGRQLFNALCGKSDK